MPEIVQLRRSPARDHYEDWVDPEDRGHDTPCWIWQGGISTEGYARCRGTNGKPIYVHRLAYERQHGPTDAAHIDHLCRVRSCVNPAHLEPVTHAENMRRGKGTKLTAADVAFIRTSGLSHAALAERFSVSKPHISKVQNGRKWADTMPR